MNAIKYILLILILVASYMLTFNEVPLGNKYTPYVRESSHIKMLKGFITSIKEVLESKYKMPSITPLRGFKLHICIEWVDFEDTSVFMVLTDYSKEASIEVFKYSRDASTSNMMTYTYKWCNVKFEERLWISRNGLIECREQKYNPLAFTGIRSIICNMKGIYITLMFLKEQYMVSTLNLEVESISNGISVFPKSTVPFNTRSELKLETLPAPPIILRLFRVDEHVSIIVAEEAYTSTRNTTSRIIDRSIIYGLIAILCLIIAIEAFIIYSYSKKIEKLRRRIRLSILVNPHPC